MLKQYEIERLGITTNNTQVERVPQTKGGEWTIVTLHNTDIVKFKHTAGYIEEIQLDTGGWNTVTTRRRMNEVSQAYGLGFRVYQKNHKLYVSYRGNDHEFARSWVVAFGTGELATTPMPSMKLT